MDLKSFYKKIDVDSIKSRLPPLPQIKIPKIKSRKIFKSSREDISQQQPPAGMSAGGPPLTPQSLPPPSAFIDRTPTRISTVSSLMNINYGFGDKHEHELPTYRTASTFEAEHCPDDGVERVSGGAATRFGDKCKKTYKDLSEFKIKNIFAKKTVVKKTEIEVDVYARQYELELQEEMELEDMQDEDRNYEFEFKEARRRMSKSSGSDSPPGSDQSGVPSPLRSEMEHLQRGETPPLLGRRRNAINDAAKSRSRLQRSLSDESGSEPPRKPTRSSLWGINENESTEDAPEGHVLSYRAGISKLGGFRRSRKEKTPGEGPAHSDSVWSLKSLRTRFASEDSENERRPGRNLKAQESSLEEQSEPEKKGAVPRRKCLQRRESLDKSSEPHASSPEGKFSTIKQSIKRLRQRKPNRENSEESEMEQPEEPAKANMSHQLRAGLRRLKLRERSISFDEEEGKPPPATATTRLRDWKKSLKLKRPTEAAPDEEAKPPPGRSLTLMRKLNQIRSRKADSEDGDQPAEPSQSDSQPKSKLNNLEKLEQARDKALKKVNAQVQRMKMFQGKSRDSPTESSPEKPERRARSPEKRPPRFSKSSSDEQPEGVVAHYSKSTTAVWTTNKIMSQSLESEDDVEVPRVLIHQDNSDQYESTLIIAVTRPAPPAPTTIIKEIPPRTKPKSEWIPNKNAISSFLEMTPSPPPVKHLDISSRGHFRKRSMDSNDSDSWIPDNFRNKSCTSSTAAGLNKIAENSEPWKVHSVFSEEKLYKTKSIDIFSKRDDTAFEDFDDEMKNVPIRRIAAASADSIEKSYAESTDDDDDYDNASRITRVKRPSPLISTTAAIETQRSIDSNEARHGSPSPAKKGQIGNSRESLDASFDDLSTDDDDAPPSVAPSPPPSFSPPPPPLPLRKPPKNIPERNDSMVRLAKPLVKQASLRRHFSEDIEPSDLGKVNKLISRFEKNPSQEHLPAIVADEEAKPVIEVEEKKAGKPKEDANRNGNKKRPAPIPKLPEIQKVDSLDNKNNNSKSNNININNNDNINHNKGNNKHNGSEVKQDTLQVPVSPETPRRKNLDNASIQSPRSEYGSPMGSMYFSENVSISSEYGSPIGPAAFPSKTLDQLHACRRLSNRSSLRDDDTFYSFESDEENNFYSFGESSSSARQTIEI